MYLVYSLKNNKVVQTNEKPFVSYDKNLYCECYVEELPKKTNAQYFIVANVREETKVIKEAYSQEETYWNEELGVDEVKVVDYPAETITYLTCDILVKDRPHISEEVKAQMLAKKQLKRYEERVEQLIRKKYTISQELAILRQRDSKPIEFANYNAYAEQCKGQAKAEIYGV